MTRNGLPDIPVGSVEEPDAAATADCGGLGLVALQAASTSVAKAKSAIKRHLIGGLEAM